MKKTYKIVLCLLCGALLCGALAGCGKSAAELPGASTTPNVTTTVDTEAGSTAVDVPAAQVDERVLTPVDTYEDRLKQAFAAVSPVPAQELTYTVDEDGVTVTGYTGEESAVVLPDLVEGRPVVAVAAGAFAGREGLYALSLPESVERVEFGALKGCKNMVTLRTPVVAATGEETYAWFGSLFGSASYEVNAAGVPSSLSTLILTGGEEISDYCFYGCSGLREIRLPDGLATIGKFSFYGCDSLAYIPLPQGLTGIGDHAFAHDVKLLGLRVPATVETLGVSLLEGCAALETLTLPFVGGSRTENTYLGYLFGATDHTFTEGFIPASLIRVTLSEGCTTVPANAFYSCSRLREVILPEGVTTIGHRAFYRCAFLTSMSLPASLTAIGDETFKGCLKLTEMDLSMITDGDRLGVQCFMNCKNLRRVTLADGVEPAAGVFAGCYALEKFS